MIARGLVLLLVALLSEPPPAGAQSATDQALHREVLAADLADVRDQLADVQAVLDGRRSGEDDRRGTISSGSLTRMTTEELLARQADLEDLERALATEAARLGIH